MNKYKEIPIGDYCYKTTKILSNHKIKIKRCPYFKLIHKDNETIEYCNFLKKELEIQDSVKDCDINMGIDE